MKSGASSAGDPYVPKSGNGGYRVERYNLSLTYTPARNHLSARADLSIVTTQRLARFSLDLVGLDAVKVSIDGQKADRFAARDGKLHIWPRTQLGSGASAVVSISYAGSPRPVSGTWGDVGWDLLTDGVLVASQPDGAASWFPCNDHPSNKASYRITVTTDPAYHVLANGSLVKRDTAPTTTTWTYEQDEPMATYLATVQIGRYQPVDLGRRPVRHRALVTGRLARRVEADFSSQRQMIKLFENTFGPYPFPQYTIVVTDDDLEVPLGAQGISIFGANHVNGKSKRERLIAHELAHQWFGSCLTIDRWQHIWLNEGFACFAEWLWSEASGSSSMEKLARKYWARLDTQPQDIVIADPGPDSMFDDRVYRRGALTLYALKLQLGESTFADLLLSWTTRNRHNTVSTDAFIDLARKRGGKPAVALLNDWLHKKRLPALPDSTPAPDAALLRP